MTPKLSVALTTYNHEKYIAQSLDSILAQAVAFPIEIVIGEDASTDGTRAIIESYAARHPAIRLLPAGPNLGYTRNFDATMQACNGEYVAIFDGDDIMYPGKLQKQADFLDAHPECVMVAHTVREFESATNRTTRFIAPADRKAYYTIEDLIWRGSFFANSSKVFRRSELPAEGIQPQVKSIADWCVTLQIVKTGKIGYIWETLADYRVHSGSIMRKLSGKQDYDDRMLIIDALKKRYGDAYDHLYSRQLAYAHLVFGIDELRQDRAASARQQLLASIRHKWNYAPSQYFYLASSIAPRLVRKQLIGLRNAIRRSA